MRIGLLSVCLLCTYFGIGQVITDSTFIKGNVALQWQGEQTKSGSLLYNGTEYFYNDSRLTGTPFFATDSFTKGNLIYYGQLYTGIPLKFDVLRGEVVTYLHNPTFPVKLVTEKLKCFTIGSAVFVWVEKTGGMPEAGYYQVLYNGKASILAKRYKTIRETVSAEGVVREVVNHSNYYVLKNGIYHSVGSKGSLLDALSDQKSALSDYIDKSDVKFKKDPEYNMIRAAAYYETL
jgi:hypothetical protein